MIEQTSREVIQKNMNKKTVSKSVILAATIISIIMPVSAFAFTMENLTFQVNVFGSPFQGAKVTIFNAAVQKIQYTNSSGETTFNTPQLYYMYKVVVSIAACQMTQTGIATPDNQTITVNFTISQCH